MSEDVQNQIDIGQALIVDDDPILHEIVGQFLNGLGIRTVVSAMDGNQAIDHINSRDGNFDVIICDINMPGKDGVEFFSYLNAVAYQNPLVIVSSADARIVTAAEALGQAFSLNLIATLGKPVDFNELRSVLEASGVVTERAA